MAPQVKYNPSTGAKNGQPHSSKVLSSNLVSPPAHSSVEDIGHSSDGHLDPGIYSDEHDQLISPEEDDETVTSGLKLKLAATHDK
jgi:hypothetical protein